MSKKVVSVPLYLAGGNEVDGLVSRRKFRVLIGDEPSACWLQTFLEKNPGNWLLDIALRNSSFREKDPKACLVQCGDGYDLVVVLDDEVVPRELAAIPRIEVVVGVADGPMNKVEEKDDPIGDFGVCFPGDSLATHFRSLLEQESHVSAFITTDAMNAPVTKSKRVRVVRLQVDDEWTVTSVNASSFDSAAAARKKSSTPSNSSTKNNEKAKAPTASPVSSLKKTKEASNKQSPQVPKEGYANKQSKATKEASPSNPSKATKETTPEQPTKASKPDSAPPPPPAIQRTPRAEKSCFYAPFCTMLAKECGGFMEGKCSQVNNDKIELPPLEEFLLEKKKFKAEKIRKRLKERKNELKGKLASKPQSSDKDEATLSETIDQPEHVADASAFTTPPRKKKKSDPKKSVPKKSPSIAKESIPDDSSTESEKTPKRKTPKKDKTIASAEANVDTDEKEPSARRQSCFYAPFCMMDASACGGYRRGECKQVNEKKIELPSSEEEFQARKKKFRNDRIKKRRRSLKAAEKEAREKRKKAAEGALIKDA